MDRAKKRKIRLITTLAIALLLATALVYTSFSASTVARTPSQLRASAQPGRSYELSGRVVNGSLVEHGQSFSFRVADRDGGKSIPVTYSGTVPDPFREGREVIVSGTVKNGVFAGKPGSLITKCPSKFSNKDT
ncbi:MAG: cytochrome c maturation protein CcmE [Thermoleophilia bacterium]|nr:cytochrome c maturation protein CcmE [Thermoleophilia bacterium]